mmetsp:Transcript_18473/g.56732  ORF Transcript_18473/g.56732 Transcript_18473/m.56732 type:complete len:244 (+) Transcript_18473:149-880(+)
MYVDLPSSSQTTRCCCASSLPSSRARCCRSVLFVGGVVGLLLVSLVVFLRRGVLPFFFSSRRRCHYSVVGKARGLFSAASFSQQREGSSWTKIRKKGVLRDHPPRQQPPPNAASEVGEEGLVLEDSAEDAFELVAGFVELFGGDGAEDAEEAVDGGADDAEEPRVEFEGQQEAGDAEQPGSECPEDVRGAEPHRRPVTGTAASKPAATLRRRVLDGTPVESDAGDADHERVRRDGGRQDPYEP